MNRSLQFRATAMRFLCSVSLLLALLSVSMFAQAGAGEMDSDHDGLSDSMEQALLVQFAPTFLIATHDCSNTPAEFAPDIKTPQIEAENGTIYGQVFPAKASTPEAPVAEIHYYHLWRMDCGAHGHPLDTEHVAVLVRASDSRISSAKWTAIYWYAAAHENTVCDVSQIARASTLHATEHGARVWISPGKHASYLNETLCRRGCGADRCDAMMALPAGKIINLGEVGHPMNGSIFISAATWPLAVKMSISNFPAAAVTRLNELPDSDIAWFNPGKHPAQGIIATSSSTEQAIAGGGSNTTAAISLAEDQTGDALQKSYRHTKHALVISTRHIGDALHVTKKPDSPE